MSFNVGLVTVIDSNRVLQNYRANTIVISSSTTAIPGSNYVATANLTLSLPASPQTGDIVGFKNSSGLTTCIIACNTNPINSITQDLYVNTLDASFQLQYSGNTTIGWVIF